MVLSKHLQTLEFGLDLFGCAILGDNFTPATSHLNPEEWNDDYERVWVSNIPEKFEFAYTQLVNLAEGMDFALQGLNPEGHGIVGHYTDFATTPVHNVMSEKDYEWCQAFHEKLLDLLAALSLEFNKSEEESS